jgi:hypothetical protein
MYKIRVNCTSKDDFNFMNRKIRARNIQNIEKDLESIDGLQSMYILTKTLVRENNKIERDNLRNFSIVSLEMLLNRSVSENEFVDIIQKLQNCGFSSNTRNKIQLVDNQTGIVLYSYEFKSKTKKNTVQKKKRYTYKYRQEMIYKSPT